MRPLVSYDDIAPKSAEPGQTFSRNTADIGSPPKKRRKNNRQGQRHRNDDSSSKKLQRDYGLKEESRQLTQEDIWDDSALIRAWDAAVEEYEVLNGPEKKWKTEPVNKSALWFNIPLEQSQTSVSPGPSFLMPSIPAAFAAQGEEQVQELECSDPDNSQPVNFDTFVPRHDPALSNVVVTEGDEAHVPDTSAKSPYATIIPPAPPGVSRQVSKDEAFQQAISAWYWAGYWSGIYHSASNRALPQPQQEGEANGCERDVPGGEVDDEEAEQEEDIHVDGPSGDEDPIEQDGLIPT